MYLTRGKENSPGKGKAFDVAAEEKKRDEDDAKQQEMATSVGGQMITLDPPPKPKRAKFQTFKDTTLPQVKLEARQAVRRLHAAAARAVSEGARLSVLLPRRAHRARHRPAPRRRRLLFARRRIRSPGAWRSVTGKVDIPRDFGDRDEEGKELHAVKATRDSRASRCSR